MLLVELFDSKIDYKVEVASAHKFMTSATIEDREIIFVSEIEDQGRYGMEATIEFGEMKPGRDGKKRITYDLTGSGGEMKVFSMVGQSVKEMVNRYQPDMILFTADKDGKETSKRADVYEKLLKKFAPEYEAMRKDAGQSILFQLVKK